MVAAGLKQPTVATLLVTSSKKEFCLNGRLRIETSLHLLRIPKPGLVYQVGVPSGPIRNLSSPIRLYVIVVDDFSSSIDWQFACGHS